jgi:perosamine synthetase
VEKFERAFARWTESSYAVSCPSGTAAIHLALAAAGVKPGDEVLLPALTMVATALPVIYLGAKPVLVDVRPDTGTIDENKIVSKITEKTVALIPVHLHGHPANMTAIKKTARHHHLKVIEDAAEAHGARIGTRMAGSIGDMGCFSFYGNKILTTGEGGMVTTMSKRFDTRIRLLRNLARTPGRHVLHQEVAYAYRMGNLQAALGLAQTEEADTFVAKKRHIAALYTRLLQRETGMTLPVELPGYRSVFWHYGILLSNGKVRNRIERQLAKKGIETREFFIPLHRQPAFTRLGLFRGERYPVAEDLGRRGLCLPSGLTITDAQIRFVCKTLISLL